MSKQARFVLYVIAGWMFVLLAPIALHLWMEN